jgi:NTE family protein
MQTKTGNRLRRGLVAALAALAVLGLAAPGRSSAEPAPRPRVGLALGGGSARGFAHIGVLQWFDEHRIPVDVIGGTSMGALVGGAFATGMSPKEIRVLVDSIDWALVLSPDAPFVYKTFRRKEDTRAYPSQLRFGLKGGFKLPSSLSPGEQVELLFDRIAAPYGASVPFDALPTPFRCVATDLTTASQVIFDHGWLAQALRSTMALPGIFSPVRIGPQVLVDGGVLNNVPADIVKGTGLADVVIAVDVSADLSYDKTADNIIRALFEMLDVMMRSGTERALASADLVLVPDLKGFTATDFGKANGFFKQGYAAAAARANDLLKYAVSEAEYAAWLASRAEKRRIALPAPVSIRVDGVGPRQAAEIQRRLKAHVGRPINYDLLDRDLLLLTGAGRYDTATYGYAEEDGRPILVIRIAPKLHGPPFLSLALDLQNTQGSDVAATIRSRMTLFDVLGAGSEGRLDISLGNTMAAAAEAYRPVKGTGLFVAPRLFTERRDVPLFVDEAYTAEYRARSSGAALDVGYAAGRTLETRLGYTVEDVRYEKRIGDDALPAVDGQQQFASVRAVFDNQTGPTIPQRGAYVRSELRRYVRIADVVSQENGTLAEPDRAWSGEIVGTYYHPLGSRGRLFAGGGAGGWFGHTAYANAFTLGGPFELGAFYTDELRGSNYVLANLGYFHEIARLAEGAVGRLYLGAWLDEGSTFEHLDSAAFHTNLTSGFILESPLGPVFAGGSVGASGRYRIYVGIGPILRR